MRSIILFSILVSSLIRANGQTITITTTLPPEIKLVPLPARVVIFQDFEIKDLHVSRGKKEKLIQECTDSLLPAFKKNVSELLTNVEFILIARTEKADSLNSPAKLITHYRADLAFGISAFRPMVEQDEVVVEENDEGKKDRTARYNIKASGTINIYTKELLVGSFPFSQSKFLEERMVMSGLLAAGPSLVKNKESAIGVTMMTARDLAGKFISQQTGFVASIFSMSELRDVTDLIRQGENDEALPRAQELTTHAKEAVSARAHYYCAMIYHQRGDLAKAYEHIRKASEARDLQRVLDYQKFLKKYVIDNEVLWNK